MKIMGWHAFFVVVVLLSDGSLAATSFQKECQALVITSMAGARSLCQGISPGHFVATPMSAAEDAQIISLLGGDTAILGAGSQSYTNTYTWEHGPRQGETFMVNSGGVAVPVNGYYHGFTGTIDFGASNVVAIDSSGWQSYVPFILGSRCAICASRPASEVCNVTGTSSAVAGNWLSSASCTCRSGFRGSDCSLQFQSYCDGPFGTLDAYDTQCAARGMFLAAPNTLDEFRQVGRSIPQHLTVNYLLGGTKNVSTGYWSWGYGPNKARSFFDEVSRQRLNRWPTGEALLGGTDTHMVQLSTLGWYDQSAMGTCYTCQMRSCDLACNAVNTLSSSGSTWPACTCTCKPGFYGPTCDCPVYGCYEPGLLSMEWQSGTLDKCSCVCKPKFFAPFCFPSPTLSLSISPTTTLLLSDSIGTATNSYSLANSLSRSHSRSATGHITSTETIAQSETQSLQITSSGSMSFMTTTHTLFVTESSSLERTNSNSFASTLTLSMPLTSSLTAIISGSHSIPPTSTVSPTSTFSRSPSQSQPRTTTLSPSLTSSNSVTLTLAESRTTSDLVTSSQTITITDMVTPTPPSRTNEHTPTDQHTPTLTYSPSTPTTQTLSDQHTSTLTHSPSATATQTPSESRTPDLIYFELPFSQRPLCPSTTFSWFRKVNGSLVPANDLTDKMFRTGGVVVNVTITAPDVSFRRSSNVISFGVESLGVSDPRSFPTSVNLNKVVCQFGIGSVRSVLCEFPASPGYTIRTSESLSVRVAEDGTTVGTCRTNGYYEVGRSTVKPADADTLLQSLQAAFAVAASLTTAIIIVFADGSPIETQVLVMMMDSPCASNLDRASVVWIKYIVMPASDGGIAWMMGGNILIATSFLILHSLLVFILYQVRLYRLKKLHRKTSKKEKRGDTANQSKKISIVTRNNLLRDTCTTLMYPGVSVNIGLVMYAGVSYGTMSILRSQSGISATVAAAGLLYVLLIPVCVLYILLRVAKVVYHRYNWAEENISQRTRWLYPHGFWAPKEQMFRLQGALGPFRVGMHYGVFFPIAMAFLMGVFLNGLAGTIPCDYLYVVAGVICLLSGMAMGAVKPLRSTVQSALTAVCLISLGTIAVLQIVAIRTGLEVLVTLKGVTNYILISTLAIRTAHSIFVFVVEYRHKDIIVEQMKECGEVMSEVSEQDVLEETEDDEAKDVEMIDDCPIDGRHHGRRNSSMANSQQSYSGIASTLTTSITEDDHHKFRGDRDVDSFLGALLDEGYRGDIAGWSDDDEGFTAMELLPSTSTTLTSQQEHPMRSVNGQLEDISPVTDLMLSKYQDRSFSYASQNNGLGTSIDSFFFTPINNKEFGKSVPALRRRADDGFFMEEKLTGSEDTLKRSVSVSNNRSYSHTGSTRVFTSVGFPHHRNIVRRLPRETSTTAPLARNNSEAHFLYGDGDSLNGSRAVIPPMRRCQRRSIAFSTNSYSVLHDGFDCPNESRRGGPTKIAHAGDIYNTPLCNELMVPSTRQDQVRFDSTRDHTLLSNAASVSPDSSSNGMGPIFGDLGVTDFSLTSPSQSLSTSRAVLVGISGRGGGDEASSSPLVTLPTLMGGN